MKKINGSQLFTLILITQIFGLLSNLLSGQTRQIYTALIKPPLAPPGWLFGVIWPLLYLLIGMAAYLIYQKPQTAESKIAIRLYWAQLLVNFLWPIVFFRFEWYDLAVGVIILLDVLVAVAVIRFYNVKKIAGYLMVPYLLWILFATYLNIGVALLN